MKDMEYWKFSSIGSIENTIFNSALEKFYGLGVDGLVRENIQNSMDAKVVGNDDPVEVRIELHEMRSDDIPGINEIRSRIDSLKGENDYSRDTIDHMMKEKEESFNYYISFEDKNTRGLSGARKGQNFGVNETWGAYAYKKGVHPKENDMKKESLRGGSHGIGKIASNAASDLNMMFFANCDENGDKHLGGTVQLIEHKYNDKFYRDTGYFSNERDGTLYPYENNFNDIFKKDTRGLKIIIPFFRKQNCNIKDIVCSICDNFFLAILNEKLVVKVNELMIDSKTILNIVSNSEYYENQEISKINKIFTLLYINTYMNMKSENIEIKDKNLETYSFKLFLNYDQNIKKGRMAIVRRVGMKIEDKKIINMATTPFNAVLVPISDKEDKFLKSLENESHTSLSWEHIKDQDDQQNAKKFIKNISISVGNYIADIMKKENPVDGNIDTSDILYSVESNFKKELQKDVSIVQLTKRGNKSKRNVVKVKSSRSQYEANNKKENKKHSTVTHRKSSKRQDGSGKYINRVRFGANPEEIKRIVLGEKEVLCIDLSNNSGYDNEKSCNMAIHIMDGSGNEYSDEFNLLSNYESITDMNLGSVCEFDKTIIKNVEINDKKIKLEFNTTKNYNRSLKFVYYVEV